MHPIHTEVVCSIKGRDELLSSLFGLLFIRQVLINKDKLDLKAFLLPGLYMFMALLAKESSITFIGIVPFIYYFQGFKDLKKIVLRLLPFVAVAGLFLLIRELVLTGETTTNRGLLIYNGLNGAKGFEELYATRFYILWLFIKKMLLPYPLSWDYSYNQIPMVKFTEPAVIASILIHIGLIWLTIKYTLKRAPIAFGLLFFFITSAITNNFLMIIGATFAERFLFVPSIGFLIFLVAAGIMWIGKNKADLFSSKALLYTLGLIAFIFSIITYARVPVWKNNFALFKSGAETATNSTRAMSALATSYREKAEQSALPDQKREYYNESKKYYQKSLEILPSNFDSYYNLGVIAYAQGDTAKALEHYRNTLKHAPEFNGALHNLAVIYLQNKKYDSAVVYLEKIYKIYPEQTNELLNLTFANIERKNYKDALKYVEIALKVEPENPSHYRNRAAIASATGDTATTRIYWDKFLKMGGKP